jgi:RND family efflux transporter MFP subunit
MTVMNWSPQMRHLTLPLALCLLLAACGRGEKEKAAQNQPPPEIVLGPEDAAVVIEGPISAGPALSGTLAAREQATVRAQLGGTVLETYAEPGERVRRGEVLARLDTAALSDTLTFARTAVNTARSQVALAEREAERQRALLAAGAVAARNVETAQQQTVAARAQLAQAQAQLAQAQEQLGNTRITAPFTGVVSEMPFSAGDVVQPGTALYTIIDPSSLELEASVPAERLEALHVGAPVTFRVNGLPGRDFTGRVARINPSVDPTTRQVRVYAEIPNDEGELVAGLFAEGRIATEARNALTVPTNAIDSTMQRPAILVVREGKVRRVDVELGLRDEQEQRVEVRRGVQAGEVVLVGAAQEITPGTAVRVAPAVREQAERLAANL